MTDARGESITQSQGRMVVPDLSQNGGQNFGNVLALERAMPREHFIEDCSECPNIRSPIDGSAFGLFWSHV